MGLYRNEITGALGFHSSKVGKRRYDRLPYTYGEFYSPITDSMLLPFQLTVYDWSKSEGYPSVNISVRLFDAETERVVVTAKASGTQGQVDLQEVVDELKTHYTYDTKTDTAVFRFMPSLSRYCIQSSTLEGHRFVYFEIEINDNTFYSEAFGLLPRGRLLHSYNNRTLVEQEYVKLCFRNSTNLKHKDGFIDFSDGFTFRVAVRAYIGRPEYRYEEEVTERGGYSYMESQTSKKVFRFTFVAPEYLCDLLRVMRLCDERYITNGFNCTYEVIDMDMEVEWQEQGNLAAVTIEFETDNVIANIGGYKAK